MGMFDGLRERLLEDYTDEEVQGMLDELDDEIAKSKGERVLFVPMQYEAKVEGLTEEEIESLKDYVIGEFKALSFRIERFHNMLLGADTPTSPENTEGLGGK